MQNVCRQTRRTGSKHSGPSSWLKTGLPCDFFHKRASLRPELPDFGYIDPADLDLFRIVAETVTEHIDRFYRRCHSSRYSDEPLVIRLYVALPAERIDRLREAFSDVLAPQGYIAPATAVPEEANETHLGNLPPLILDFNQRNFAPPHHLIDAINV